MDLDTIRFNKCTSWFPMVHGALHGPLLRLVLIYSENFEQHLEHLWVVL